MKTREQLQQLVDEYAERFGEPFPVWGYEDDEIERLIKQALEKGEPVTAGAEQDIPKDALL